MIFNKLSWFVCVILILANLGTDPLADSSTPDSYALPRDKTILELCQQAALASLAGKITAFQIYHTADGFHYSFKIETPDKTAWTVVCNGQSRKIIQIQNPS